MVLRPAERFPFVRFPEGNIHGILQSEFLNAEPYDVVIVYHVLQHVFSVADSLEEDKETRERKWDRDFHA